MENQAIWIAFPILGLLCLMWAIYSIRKKNFIAKCGHKTRIKGKISAFGETITMKMLVNKDGSVEYCLECIGKMAILCAWCKKPIFIGSSITLYSPRNKDEFELPENAVIYDKERMAVVGCGRTTCAETGADYAGQWIPDEDGKGKVHRRPTIIE
ncbi:MAG: hypothetical protein KAR54_00535 [Candidatus Pacebacteria bacterium]|nr:hypothetical protein [Candidatus Paceibacterota bacterium]